MSNIDLSTFSLDELTNLIAEATAIREGIIQKRRKELLDELDWLGGISVTPSGRKRKMPQPRFQYTLDDKVWTGMGRKPKWLVDFIAGGGDVDAIKKRFR